MNDIEKYFRQNNKRAVHKFQHYFNIYDNHFKRYRNKEVVILEIGVAQGGSLQMWKDYFGEKAKIYGMDIDPRCKALEEENIKVLIGSQSDRKFLREVKTQIPPIDILIDDGGHTMVQQIVTYEELFDSIKEDGIYLCEDLHTSYWLNHGGGHKRKSTFIEYSKNFIDSLNAYHSKQRSLRVNEFTNSVDSIHYYDSIMVIEKKKRDQAPQALSSGSVSFQTEQSKDSMKNNLYKMKESLVNAINLTLRFFGIKYLVRVGGIFWKK